MHFSWEHDVDSLVSWAELEDYLRDPWRAVRDRRTGLTLSTHVDELVVDEPASGTASQRRALHKAGFRRREPRCWTWTPPEPVDLPPPNSFPPRMAIAFARAERNRALGRSRSAQALLVLREVYRAAPAELVVMVPEDDEDDEWDEDDDEHDAAWPALDCAALEVLFGPGRRTTPQPP